MFTLVVFDLDGTIVDSRRDIADSANALLAACGAGPLAEDRLGGMVGDGAAALVARAFEAAGLALPSDALARYLACYDARLLAHTRPYPGIADVLDILQSQVKLAVLTNKPLAATRAVLDGLGLSRYFPADAVIGGDGTFPRKPDAAGLQYLMASAGVPADATLLVGDSETDWRTACVAGTSICLARYGFGFEGFPVERLRPGDRVIDAPAELLGLLPQTRKS
jgi:phosphoglycolate phosphatase